MGKYTFRKEERLNSEKDIQELFSKGSSFYLYPFKVLQKESANQAHPFHQILISVPARNFKRAVDRNLIKRRIREAYRLNKAAISSPTKLLIAYIYTAKDILEFNQIQEKMVRTFKQLGHEKKN